MVWTMGRGRTDGVGHGEGRADAMSHGEGWGRWCGPWGG